MMRLGERDGREDELGVEEEDIAEVVGQLLQSRDLQIVNLSSSIGHQAIEGLLNSSLSPPWLFGQPLRAIP